MNDERNADERYRALFDGANDTITILSIDGIVLEANRRWEDVLQLPAGQLVGRPINEFAAASDRAQNLAAFTSIVETGQGRAVAKLLRADGVPILIELSCRVVELDQRPVVFAIGHEVTESVQAAQALKTAEEKYRSLVERIPEIIWTMDERGGLTYVAPNDHKLQEIGLGGTSSSCLTQIASRIHPQDREAVLEACAALLHDGTTFDLEYRRRAEDGRWIWLRNRAFASYERDGVRYAEGMLSNITERKLLEEELRQAQKMEAIGRLTGGIAHDFNNMLVAISANSHFLCEALSSGDPRRSDAEEIKLVAERAAALTRQLLAFSRRQLLTPTILDLNSSLLGLEKMLRRLIGEDIEFTLVRAPNLGAIRADPGQIEQVVMNLVVNARDAMPTGGKLRLETANVEVGRDEGSAHVARAGKYVVCSVTDSGVGMDAETKRRLFEPFFTTKEGGRGTGLGLSTCYGIVSQSGGWIDVRSEPGQGSTFSVYLPEVEGRAAEKDKPSAEAKLFGSETLLVVEDDERVRAAVTRMLEDWGYSLLVARDGAEAVDIAARHEGPIKLVLSDMVMPGQSGPETVRKVRALHPQTKALFMSGYSDHVLLPSEEQSHFIQKPFPPSVLAKKVREALDGDCRMPDTAAAESGAKFAPAGSS